uniref:Uncharacterized protein n=1 Tax=Arundo donax TaxID=35708 RepID=A0A0A9G427_ARUDO
MVVAEAALGE